MNAWLSTGCSGSWLASWAVSSFRKSSFPSAVDPVAAGVGGAVAALPGRLADPAAEVQAAVARLAPPDVVAGAHGEAVREAAEAQVAITRVLAGLGAADKALLPDVAPTVTQLAERVGAMAQSLHQLDLDANPDAVARLERRLAEAKALPEGAADRARRLELLERQLGTMLDLVTRRDEVAAQLEHTRLLLQTMKLDLLKFRSGGLQAQLAEHPGATQEARAIAAEIERAVEVAREVRDLR